MSLISLCRICRRLFLLLLLLLSAVVVVCCAIVDTDLSTQRACVPVFAFTGAHDYRSLTLVGVLANGRVSSFMSASVGTYRESASYLLRICDKRVTEAGSGGRGVTP